jgi:NAD+ kinase
VKIGIVTKPALAEARPTLLEIETWLRDHQVEAFWSREAADLLPSAVNGRQVREREAIPEIVDLVLVLGGDGTLLAMADRIAAAERDIPILGVNFGSLGFLTEITRPEVFESLTAVVSGAADLDERMMLRATVGGASFIALNDVVITRHALSRMVEVSVWVGEQFVTTVKADGLIIASPTGSTAYNLSAGGPIVHPAMEAILITPIAPHMLTNRPIVIPASREVRASISSTMPGDGMHVTFDGQSGFPLDPGQSVTIGRAERPLLLVRAPSRSYFEVLRQKLKWNER